MPRFIQPPPRQEVDQFPPWVASLRDFILANRDIGLDPTSFGIMPMAGTVIRQAVPKGTVDDILRDISTAMVRLLHGKAPIKEADPDIVRQMRALQNIGFQQFDPGVGQDVPAFTGRKATQLFNRAFRATEAIEKAKRKAGYGRTLEGFELPIPRVVSHAEDLGFGRPLGQPMMTLKTERWLR